MSEEVRYEISNVGGIDRAELVLKPGVNVLHGRNAIGKTSAMRAIVRAQGGEMELERRDGSSHGEVRGPGVRLRVGKVVTKTGAAELSLADVSPLSTLIEPGYKDSEANARARIRALIELLGVAVDDAAIETLCQGDAELLEWLRAEVQTEAIDDLMLAAEKLRHHAHGLARSYESQAEEAEGQAKSARTRTAAALEALGGRDHLVDQSVEDARTALVEGSRRYERAVAQCEARATLEARQAEIQGSIGDRPDPDPAKVRILTLRADLADIDAEIEQLQAALSDAQQRRAGKAAEVKAQEERAVELGHAAKRWNEQQAILAQAPEGPTREELGELEAELVGRATAHLQASERSQQYRVSEIERQEAEATREQADREGERLRDLAAALPSRLGEILAAAGAEGLTVIDGRLQALQGGKTLDWERRLSDGQRVRAALDVAAQVYAGRVVPLSGIYWTSLDPANRAEFAQLAEERGLYVISEEAADGELRVDHVGQPEQSIAAGRR